MKISQLLTKTIKQAPSREESLNSRLLIQAGFIDKTMAGVYSFLPLGWRVMKKLKNIIREEMDGIGGQEIFMPSLSPREFWETTGRLEKVDNLFQARAANKLSKQLNDSSYVICSTHEEVVTPLVQKHTISYKDLPVAVYQIQNKFRNEARPKSGLLRGREFLMKDLYSFHTTQEDLKQYYEEVKKAYLRVFERLGVLEDTYVTLASGGDFTDEYSHEFQTKCPTGEDLCFHAPSARITFNQEVAPSLAPRSEDDEEEKALEKVKTPDIVTIDKLCDFLSLDPSRTVKTLLYETEDGGVVAVALRGDYDVCDLKLKDVLAGQVFDLASEEKIKEITGAELGYSGLIGLGQEVKIICDDSLKDGKNMAMGANETDYHLLNVNFSRDIPNLQEFFDIKTAKPGDLYPETGEKYESFKASEVANIFILDTKYSQDFDYYYTDAEGNKKPVYMGCYGLGPSRLMGVLAEKFSDDSGLSWPEAAAPFRVHLISLKENRKADELYQELQKRGCEVLYDDRDEVSAGEKFADADLIGCPLRLVISQKTLADDCVEWKERKSQSPKLVGLSEIYEKLGV